MVLKLPPLYVESCGVSNQSPKTCVEHLLFFIFGMCFGFKMRKVFFNTAMCNYKTVFPQLSVKDVCSNLCIYVNA